MRELGAQRAQVGPGRLERERVAQRLVGPLRLERAALAREQAAERAPGLGVRGREVDGDLELARRLVDAPERLERAPAQEARALPRRQRARERLDGGERRPRRRPRRARAAASSARARSRGAHGGRGPGLERVRALVERDGVEEIEHALALRGRERRRRLDAPSKRLEARARRRRAPDGALEVRDAQEEVEAPLPIVLERREPLLEIGDDRALAIPARRIVGEQIGEVHVGVEPARILLDGAAQRGLGLRAAAELARARSRDRSRRPRSPDRRRRRA